MLSHYFWKKEVPETQLCPYKLCAVYKGLSMNLVHWHIFPTGSKENKILQVFGKELDADKLCAYWKIPPIKAQHRQTSYQWL